MKSAHLVAQGYANFCKMVSMVIVLVLDPESRDMYNCHPYQFFEICIPMCNDPMGLIKWIEMDVHEAPSWVARALVKICLIILIF